MIIILKGLELNNVTLEKWVAQIIHDDIYGWPFK